ncbi:MAG: N-formylglutamate amidohydrolase [Deltaproteobacteria bacterium]|nr:N-formylglutamate amidohydrolase [Deltaproteobacteria bacterium]
MKLPFIISLPHCSGRIPKRIQAGIRLTPKEAADAIDLGTLEIFGGLPAFKVLCAQWSRLVVDLNRPSDQRHAKGPIALVDYHGRQVYRSDAVPDEEEITHRLSTYYEPYHRQLANAVEMAHIKGLLDCHSLQGSGPAEAPDAGRIRNDITLGNNGRPDGKRDSARGELTCTPALMGFVRQVFEGAGFSVSINFPYAGGFIVAHYGPGLAAGGKMALQIEINQDLYLDPVTESVVPEKAEKVKAGIFACLKKIGKAL